MARIATAHFVRHLSTDADHVIAALYRLDPPMILMTPVWEGERYVEREQTSEYVRVSASWVPYSGAETYIFLADDQGSVLNWSECDGSFRGRLDFIEALNNAGYEVQED